MSSDPAFFKRIIAAAYEASISLQMVVLRPKLSEFPLPIRTMIVEYMAQPCEATFELCILVASAKLWPVPGSTAECHVQKSQWMLFAGELEKYNAWTKEWRVLTCQNWSTVLEISSNCANPDGCHRYRCQQQPKVCQCKPVLTGNYLRKLARQTNFT